MLKDNSGTSNNIRGSATLSALAFWPKHWRRNLFGKSTRPKPYHIFKWYGSQSVLPRFRPSNNNFPNCYLHQQRSVALKYAKMRWRPGLRPGPSWGSSRRSTRPHSTIAPTWVTQFYLQITPCLPLIRKRSPDGATHNWGNKHATAAYYSFIDPKGWKAKLAWLADLQRTVYPHKWSLVSYRSSAGQGKFAGQRPTFYRCATQPTVTHSPWLLSKRAGYCLCFCVFVRLRIFPPRIKL